MTSPYLTLVPRTEAQARRDQAPKWRGDYYMRLDTLLGYVEERDATPVLPWHDNLDEPLWLAKAGQYYKLCWTRDEAVSFVEQWDYTT